MKAVASGCHSLNPAVFLKTPKNKKHLITKSLNNNISNSPEGNLIHSLKWIFDKIWAQVKRPSKNLKLSNEFLAHFVAMAKLLRSLTTILTNANIDKFNAISAEPNILDLLWMTMFIYARKIRWTYKGTTEVEIQWGTNNSNLRRTMDMVNQ